ncbi:MULTISPECIES: YggT family protein [unclassified Bacillus cereus group]|uniref:YggT family protein n=1 Tax=unclassified Bacillus cereus group TaxID=2750818 RepID=UPI003390E840
MVTVLNVLITAIKIYSWALIIYILLSWFPGAKESTFGEILARICEPYLEPFRRFIPPLGMIDISPLVAIFTLKLATNGLISIFNYFL